MTIGCNIWMICLTLNWFFYGPSRILQWLQFSQFVWTLRSSLWDVFHNFLLIDATDRSKSSSDQKRFFIALSLYPLSFFANTPFKDSFETYETFLRRIFTEFERKVDVQNHEFGWVRFQNRFLKLLNNDDKKCKQNSTVN